jgi:hypothetical protein
VCVSFVIRVHIRRHIRRGHMHMHLFCRRVFPVVVDHGDDYTIPEYKDTVKTHNIWNHT